MDLNNCDWFSDASEKPISGKNIEGQEGGTLDRINQQYCLRFIWLLFIRIPSTHCEIFNRKLSTLHNDSAWMDESFSPWRWSTFLRNVGINLRSYPVSNLRGLPSGQYPPPEPDYDTLRWLAGNFKFLNEKRGNHAVATYRISNMQTEGNLWSGIDDNKGPEIRDHLPPLCGWVAIETPLLS